MLSDTLVQGLDRYAIGDKLRALRQGKEMGLVELGAHTGLSPGLLSKLERGRLYPTLPTLLRIALVFGVGLDHFFTDATRRPVCVVARGRERVRLPSEAGERRPPWFFESLTFGATQRLFDAYWADFQDVAEAALEPHQHAGAELLFVTQGRLDVQVGEERHALGRGDAMYFDSRVPHTYRKRGSGPCSAVVVTLSDEGSPVGIVERETGGATEAKRPARPRRRARRPA